jgi:hypothetical protein
LAEYILHKGLGPFELVTTAYLEAEITFQLQGPDVSNQGGGRIFQKLEGLAAHPV